MEQVIANINLISYHNLSNLPQMEKENDKIWTSSSFQIAKIVLT